VLLVFFIIYLSINFFIGLLKTLNQQKQIITNYSFIMKSDFFFFRVCDLEKVFLFLFFLTIPTVKHKSMCFFIKKKRTNATKKKLTIFRNNFAFFYQNVFWLLCSLSLVVVVWFCVVRKNCIFFVCVCLRVCVCFPIF
jgi:hypothetical protein